MYLAASERDVLNGQRFVLRHPWRLSIKRDISASNVQVQKRYVPTESCARCMRLQETIIRSIPKQVLSDAMLSRSLYKWASEKRLESGVIEMVAFLHK